MISKILKDFCEMMGNTAPIKCDDFGTKAALSVHFCMYQLTIKHRVCAVFCHTFSHLKVQFQSVDFYSSHFAVINGNFFVNIFFRNLFFFFCTLFCLNNQFSVSRQQQCSKQFDIWTIQVKIKICLIERFEICLIERFDLKKKLRLTYVCNDSAFMNCMFSPQKVQIFGSKFVRLLNKIRQ